MNEKRFEQPVSTPNDHERIHRAHTIRERVYLTLAALAVVIGALSNDHATSVEVAITLALTVVGMLLALFIAEIIERFVEFETLPTRAQVLEMLSVAYGSLGAVAVPFALLATADLRNKEIHSALGWSIVWLVASLVVTSYLAVRKLSVTPLQRSIVLGIEAILALLVLVIKLLAH